MHEVNLFVSLQLNLSNKRAASFSGGNPFVLRWSVQIQQENVCACSYTQPVADPSEPRNLNTRVSEHLLLSASTQPPRTTVPALFWIAHGHLMLASTNLAHVGLSAARSLQVQLGEKSLSGVTAGSAISFQLLEQTAG